MAVRRRAAALPAARRAAPSTHALDGREEAHAGSAPWRNDVPVCGDSVCNGAETCGSCSHDCGECEDPIGGCGSGPCCN